MATSTVKYLGHLRTEATHLQSASTIITDAPTDNKGKGEAFSPTDLTATSLASCMITVMGIKAAEANIPFNEVTAEVTKIMGGPPRKITEIRIKIRISRRNLSDKDRTILAETAHTCPVALSLHPDIKVKLEFDYFD